MLFLFYSCCFLPFIVFHSIETVCARPSFGCMFFPFGRCEQASNTWTQLFRSFSMSPFPLQSLHRSWHLLGRMDFQYTLVILKTTTTKTLVSFFLLSLADQFFFSPVFYRLSLHLPVCSFDELCPFHIIIWRCASKWNNTIQYDSSRFSIHLVNQWSEFTGCAFANKVRQANSGFKHFQLKQQIIIFERCVFKMYWRWRRDDVSERDGTWRWRVNHTQKYSWKIKFSLTTSIFSDCLICNITSVLRLALLAFAFFLSIFWSVLFGWAVRKSG